MFRIDDDIDCAQDDCEIFSRAALNLFCTLLDCMAGASTHAREVLTVHLNEVVQHRFVCFREEGCDDGVAFR